MGLHLLLGFCKLHDAGAPLLVTLINLTKKYGYGIMSILNQKDEQEINQRVWGTLHKHKGGDDDVFE
ncbi:hypothetical protein L1987_17776 [Smallanthus sonchifolius]|uniref:Uncharacterized protein n=1 Tax=Smallanthus sonchifolius TaxID=185202 RepID=A0ACB9IYZ3_9ASTR|nr:hypothetical protein L1987_17776 [Smallanthus sonchifolius]